MKVKKGRRADKEDRRSQKGKIIGKRRETKKKQKRRTKKGRSSALRVPPAETRLTVYRRFHIGSLPNTKRWCEALPFFLFLKNSGGL